MSWDKLSMAEKAEVMKLAVEGGVYDLDAIRNGYNEYAKGGKIHIAPSKRGTFTAAASKHSKSVQAFASQVLAHPENYSPAMRKKANFARNAAKWKHGNGGNLFDGTSESSQQMQVSPYRYVLDDEGSWNRVTNDEEGRIFQGLTVTPNKTKKTFVPARIDNSYETIKKREKFMKNRDSNGSLTGEQGLEIVSPEFDLLSLGPIWKNAGNIAVKRIEKAVGASPMLENDLAKSVIDAAKFTKGTSGLKPIPKDKVDEGYQRMVAFIKSPEYQTRLTNAGLGEYQDYMINLVNKRMGKNFKANTATLIEGNPKYRGLSEMNPLAEDYGVTVREDLVGNDFLNTFDHELAHWTTKNTEPGLADLRRIVLDWKVPNFKLNKIMRYNDKIPVKPGNSLSGQERRARAYAMYQEAKRRGITTDELVDRYTIEDEIIGDAPRQLQGLGKSYTPDNLKKYLKSFLSGAFPVTLGIETTK